jgi:2-polyprenyl-3-methyl-5-hydroxy-6-metoxy-1,4-benzoquinol methylase
LDETKLALARNKYKLPYHWIRDSLHRHSLPYFGYIDVVLRELPTPPAVVLDAGCRDGRVSAELVRAGYAVTGIEYLDLAVVFARTMVPQASFIAGDLRKDLIAEYGLPRDHFDAVVMVEVYEHIPPEDCSGALSNVYGVLRPGGMIIISVPSKRLPPSALHYRHFHQHEFEREIEEAGFEIERVIYQHRLGRLTDWLLSQRVEGFLNNRWLRAICLKRLRRRLYMRYSNVVKDGSKTGRFIAVARRSAERIGRTDAG